MIPELKHVHIGWQTGTLMNGPDRLLHGAAENLKKARHLTFLPGDRIPAKLVKDFTREAARIAILSPGARRLMAALVT